MATWKERFEARQQIARQRQLREEAAWLAEMDAAPHGEGICYFLGDAEIVKIGFSRQLSQRIGVLKGSSGPIRLELLATARGGYDREQRYHRLFAVHRWQGEWFHRVPEIEAEIARLNNRENGRNMHLGSGRNGKTRLAEIRLAEARQ